MGFDKGEDRLSVNSESLMKLSYDLGMESGKDLAAGSSDDGCEDALVVVLLGV